MLKVGMFCLSWLSPLSCFIVLPLEGVLQEQQIFLGFFWVDTEASSQCLQVILCVCSCSSVKLTVAEGRQEDLHVLFFNLPSRSGSSPTRWHSADFALLGLAWVLSPTWAVWGEQTRAWQLTSAAGSPQAQTFHITEILLRSPPLSMFFYIPQTHLQLTELRGFLSFTGWSQF